MNNVQARRGGVVAAMASLLLGLLPTVALAAAPENDEIAGAKAITSVPYSDAIDTTDATASSEDPDKCLGYSPNNVWYRHTAEQTRRLVADTFGSDYDTVLAVYEEAPANETRLACNDNWKGAQSRASFDVEAGQTYYFMVAGPGGELHFNLGIAKPPPNDDIADAKNISVKMPWTFTTDTTEATLDISDPSCNGKSRSVWFRYTRPRKWDTRQIELRTFKSDYDTTLSVYSGKPGNLQQIRCDDNSGGYQSKVRFKAEPGKTYWVMVGSARNTPGGNLVLKAKQPPIPFRMEFSVNRTGSVSEVTGGATITGSVTCSRKAKLYLYVTIRQKNDDRVVTDSERRNLTCKNRKSWSVNLLANRPFEAGRAGVWVSISAPREDREKKQKLIATLQTCSQCL